ncbi:hypothetical protein [Bacillus infantis]|uniref:hypothetical protein n=1 Tax=Bacillus infantis TaxID=324767 RepID=UPI0020A1D236|nr:hypothetical protein [Bacillus infantis]MCP1159317.1 hypothetical protein [Bacillus infantis]
MAVKIGNVIKNKHGLFVITNVTDGVISHTEKLEDFISKNAIVKEDGEWKTLKDVIQRRSEMYLKSGVEIIKEF